MSDLPAIRRRIGYARVSTACQRLDIQIEALKRAGCDLIFEDHGVSGAKASRPGLDEAIGELRPDDELVVFKLDRLGRSVLHLSDLLTRLRDEEKHFCSWSEGINTATSGGKLTYHIFSAVAEFQRDLIRENTIHGLAAAKERGAPIGRPRALTLDQVLEAHRLHRQQNISIAQLARRLGVAHSTLGRAMRDLAASIR